MQKLHSTNSSIVITEKKQKKNNKKKRKSWGSFGLEFIPVSVNMEPTEHSEFIVSLPQSYARQRTIPYSRGEEKKAAGGVQTRGLRMKIQENNHWAMDPPVVSKSKANFWNIFY